MLALRASVLVGSAILIFACGDGPSGPAAANEGGTGNQLLLVQASVEIDDVGVGFLSEFTVDVFDRVGDPVSGAEVIIQGGFGPMTVPESESQGRYRAQLSGAAWGTLTLRVERDSTFVRDVVLRNIGIHTFVSPTPEDTVEADAPLVIRWFRDAEAPHAMLVTRDVTVDGIEDNGTFVLPDSLNPARPSQRFEMIRSNEVQVAGGLRGSFFKIEVSTRIEPVVVN